MPAVGLFLFLAAHCLGCSEPTATQMVAPVYPVTAQSSNLEGAVDLIIQVGMNGRVLSVEEGANKSKPDPVLIAAAKDNARQWVWGRFPQKFQFPWYHPVRYIFKLQGKPMAFPVTPAIVKTRLPDEVEIIAVPCYKTYLELEPAQPSR
jgi:Gram-negative bacterial TonB protein C-terminal